ncbi:MAG: DUF3486 family protein [Gammaproteobacteria bacterium]|nr:DUF3486 family protein [Gammaproteobacteria bacterium]
MPVLSHIDRTPPEVRGWLEQELSRRQHAGLDELISLLAEKGYEISRSVVGRFSKELKDRTARIKASHEWTAQIMSAMGDSGRQASMTANGLMQQMILEIFLKHDFDFSDLESTDHNELLLKIGALQSRLSSSLVTRDKWDVQKDTEIEKAKQATKKARVETQKAEAELKQLKSRTEKALNKKGREGFDPETLRKIREEIYGMDD